ncbi:hypothetical protein Tco_1181764, partial [Tanacetum coccineum]
VYKKIYLPPGAKALTKGTFTTRAKVFAGNVFLAPRSHGGDAGGDPPGDRRTRMLPHQCEGSGKRREIKHKALKRPLNKMETASWKPDPSYCTSEQLEVLKRQHALEKEEQRKAFESQQNALKNLWISSTVNKALIVVTTRPGHETSESGEQDDNGSDDGNREYDVDIYDDE